MHLKEARRFQQGKTNRTLKAALLPQPTSLITTVLLHWVSKWWFICLAPIKEELIKLQQHLIYRTPAQHTLPDGIIRLQRGNKLYSCQTPAQSCPFSLQNEAGATSQAGPCIKRAGGGSQLTPPEAKTLRKCLHGCYIIQEAFQVLCWNWKLGREEIGWILQSMLKYIYISF